MSLLRIVGPDDLLAVRFAWSPAWETMGAVRTFVDDRARPYHDPWHRLVAARAAALDLQPLFAVHPLRGSVPDFLSPPPTTATPRMDDQLAEVLATPPAQVERELRQCRATVTDVGYGRILDALIEEPAAARDLLAGRLHQVWAELVAPFWIRVRALLDRDIQERSRVLAGYGLRRVLGDLHPRVRWTSQGVVVEDGDSRTVDVGHRGLVLMPSAYLWPAVAAVLDEPWQPTIAYPARGVAELWSAPVAPPDALARLLGRTRALVLASLDRPTSTTAMAEWLGLSPSSASEHLLILRDSGLIAASRRRHEVLYRRTALGTSLLRRVATPGRPPG